MFKLLPGLYLVMLLKNQLDHTLSVLLLQRMLQPDQRGQNKNQLDQPIPLYTLLGILLLELGKLLLMVLVKPVLILRLVFPLMALQVLPRVLLLGKMVVLVLLQPNLL